jgi:hopanoid biosynthesis associated protein HpnK
VSARCLIVNADDLGLTEGHNRAILDAHQHGIVTSTSLLACGPAFDDAVERARSASALGIGVHLTLLEGAPVSSPAQVPDLVGPDGLFGQSYLALFRRLALRQVRMDQVRREWRAQIERVLAAGLHVTHLDSHKHVHMHPQLLPVVLALAQQFDLRRMRLSRPLVPWAGAKPAVLAALSAWARCQAAQQGVRTPGALLGLEYGGQMTTARLLAVLRRPWHGVCELMMHPAYPDPAMAWLRRQGYRWIDGYHFQEEQAALCAPQVRRALSQLGIQRVHYGTL